MLLFFMWCREPFPVMVVIKLLLTKLLQLWISLYQIMFFAPVLRPVNVRLMCVTHIVCTDRSARKGFA